MSKKKLEHLEEKILTNIDKDRDDAQHLLINIQEFLTANQPTGEEYSKIMISAAKVVENLQKSNEQILRIFESHQKKKQTPDNAELTKDEIEKIWKGDEVDISS